MKDRSEKELLQDYSNKIGKHREGIEKLFDDKPDCIRYVEATNESCSVPRTGR